MTTEHTPGPWRYTCRGEVGEFAIYAYPKPGDAKIIAHLGLNTAGDNVAGGERQANAQRIVACVNACEGINPDAVPELLAACKQVVHRNSTIAQLEAAIAKAAPVESGETKGGAG